MLVTIAKTYYMPFGLTDDFLKGFELAQNPAPQEPVTEEVSNEAVETLETVGEVGNNDDTGTTPPAETPPGEAVVVDVQEPVTPEAKEIEITDDLILKYAEKRGVKLNSVDDLFKVPEAPKSEFDGIELSEWDKKYLQFKKDTNGRPVEDFIASQKDWGQVPDIELARERVRLETGKDLSNEAIDSYLERKLGIEDISALDENDELDLAAYTREMREKKTEEQKKYAVPQEPTKSASAADSDDMITLQDGSKMPKEKYENLQSQRDEYLKTLKGAVDGVAATKFKVEFDNNGTKIPFEYEYDYGVQDKHSMLSLAEDVDATIAKIFRTEKGFDFEGFAKAVWRVNPENWEKEMAAYGNAVRAATIEEMLKEENNVNFNRSGLAKPSPKQEERDIFGNSQSGFGIKYSF